MKLADKPCYPLSLVWDDFNKTIRDNRDCDSSTFTSGLTFKERLVIALATNIGVICNSDETEIAKDIIRQADAIIKELEKKNVP